MLMGKKRRKKVSGGVSFVLKGRILLRQAQSVYVTKMELVYPSNGVMLHSGSRAMIKKIKKKERFSPYKIRTLRAQVYSLHTPVLVCHFSFSINGFYGLQGTLQGKSECLFLYISALSSYSCIFINGAIVNFNVIFLF